MPCSPGCRTSRRPGGSCSSSGSWRRWDRRRVGGRGVAPVGDLAPTLAAVDGRRAPDRREPRRDARGRWPSSCWPDLPPRDGVPGRRAAGLAGALDSPRGARAGGVARRRSSAAEDAAPVFARPVPRARSAARPCSTLLVCGVRLTAHWAFLFWYLQHLRNLPELAGWTDAREEPAGEHGHGLAGHRAPRSPGTSSPRRWPGGCATGGRSRFCASAYFAGDVRDLRRAPRSRRAVARVRGDRRSARACSRCSRCTCRRSSRRCCGPPGRASATTSAASPPGWARCSSGSSRRWATTGWRCSGASFLFLPAAGHRAVAAGAAGRRTHSKRVTASCG